MKNGGNFEAVEVEVEKYARQEEREKLRGGWHNKITLTAENWTQFLDQSYCNHELRLRVRGSLTCTCILRDMIDNSIRWAQARNLYRRNEVHGEYEWRIPIFSEFSHENIRGQASRASASFELDAGVPVSPHCCLPECHTAPQDVPAAYEDPDGALLMNTVSREATLTLLG